MSNTIFDFFGLRENPFKINPDPRFMFLTRDAQAAAEDLVYGIQSRKGLILLTGEVGTGKTMLVRRLLDWLAAQKMPTALIFNARLNTDNLFDLILNDFGIPCDSPAKSEKLICLQDWLLKRYRAGTTPVLVIDEAQGLPAEVLEEIRLLLNFEAPHDNLLQIVLSGQPELEEKLKRHELRQLRQRIAIRCKTSPLTLEQTQAYVRERLRIAGATQEIFPLDTLTFLHAFSRGIPRIINLLCEHALINSCAEGARLVAPRHVEQAARECQLERVDSVCRVLSSGSYASATLDDMGSILATISQSADLPAAPGSQPSFGSHTPASTSAPRPASPRARAAAMASSVLAAGANIAAPSGSLPAATPDVAPPSDFLPPATPNIPAPSPSFPPARAVEARFPQPLPNLPPRPEPNYAPLQTRTRPLFPPSLPLRWLQGLPLRWLRGWSRSFSADARATWSQTLRFLRSTHARHVAPLVRQARPVLDRFHSSMTHAFTNPLWLKWRNQLFPPSRKVWQSRFSTAVARAKRHRTFAALQRWLRQPMSAPKARKSSRTSSQRNGIRESD